MLDHLVFGVPDLGQGIDLLEARTGVRPAFGGRHPGRGTHNALLSLGGRRYLEIIAIDPSQADAPGLLFPALKSLTKPAFVSWAMVAADIGETAGRARAAGCEVTGPLEGSRARSDGTLLAWQTLRVSHPDLPLPPFFIDWGTGADHPSGDAPAGCTLDAFTIADPHPQAVRQVLTSLGVEAAVIEGSSPQLSARLATPKGRIELG
jgi:hypothetical protein